MIIWLFLKTGLKYFSWIILKSGSEKTRIAEFWFKKNSELAQFKEKLKKSNAFVAYTTRSSVIKKNCMVVLILVTQPIEIFFKKTKAYIIRSNATLKNKNNIKSCDRRT